MIVHSALFTINMSLSSILCRTRPEVISDVSYSPCLYEIEVPKDEKASYATEEDEMQQRLSDLRREVNEAKVDW